MKMIGPREALGEVHRLLGRIPIRASDEIVEPVDERLKETK
jgi:hypothetical protein